MNYPKSIVRPVRVEQLSSRTHFLFSHRRKWWVYTIVHRWSDGVLAQCFHSLNLHSIFLEYEQWVAAFPEEWVDSSEQDTWHSTWCTSTVRIAIQGHSMKPTIPFGAFIELEPVESSQLRVGDVITWASESYWNTHRIRSYTQSPQGRIFHTRGDALPFNDPPLDARCILGRVVRIHMRSKTWTPYDPKIRVQVYTRWLITGLKNRIVEGVHY